DLDQETFDEVVVQAWPAILTAYRYSQFDAAELWNRIHRIRGSRGTDFTRDFAFNDQSAFTRATGPLSAGEPVPPQMLAPPRCRSSLRWPPGEPQLATFVCYLDRLDDEVEMSLWMDAHRLPAADVEAFIWGVERLLVAAAHQRVPVAALSEVTGVAPVRRGA